MLMRAAVLSEQTHSQADSVADAAANLIHENSARHMGRSVTNVRPKDILLSVRRFTENYAYMALGCCYVLKDFCKLPNA